MINKEEMLEIERVELILRSLTAEGPVETQRINAFIKEHAPVMREAIPKLLEVAHVYFDLVEKVDEAKLKQLLEEKADEGA